MWANYFREKGYLVEETNKGFITAVVYDGVCMIDNWYVKPEYRGGISGMRMVFSLIKKVKGMGAKYICGEIYKSDPSFEYSLNMHKKFGMKVEEEDEFHVLTSKRISEEEDGH